MSDESEKEMFLAGYFARSALSADEPSVRLARFKYSFRLAGSPDNAERKEKVKKEKEEMKKIYRFYLQEPLGASRLESNHMVRPLPWPTVSIAEQRCRPYLLARWLVIKT